MVTSVGSCKYCRSSTFTMEAAYTEDSIIAPDADPRIASFTIGPPVSKGAPGAAEAKLKVLFRLNLHGIVTVESVNQLEEEEYEEEVKIEKVSSRSPPPLSHSHTHSCTHLPTHPSDQSTLIQRDLLFLSRPHKPTLTHTRMIGAPSHPPL